MDEGKKLVVCRCREVTVEEIEEAIRAGARTVDEVKRRTGAGLGLCPGRSCWKMVARMIIAQSGKNLLAVKPGGRAPVKPIRLGALANGGTDRDC